MTWKKGSACYQETEGGGPYLSLLPIFHLEDFTASGTHLNINMEAALLKKDDMIKRSDDEF